MKLFVYEFFVSGEMDNQDELKQAGAEMLLAVLEDFSGTPDLQLVTILDSSLKDNNSANFIARNFKEFLSNNSQTEIYWREGTTKGTELFEKILASCDSVLIIAPETAGILAELTAMAECSGKNVLGSCSQAIKITSDKAELLSLLRNKGLPIPQSRAMERTFAPDTKTKILELFSLPLVIKPIYGTGGEGVRLIETEYQLDKVLELLPYFKEDLFLVQEYISGQAVSVSLFVLNGEALPLSLNKQIINHEDELVFRGIIVPYAHPQGQEIIKAAVKACEQVPGLKGFVGVDLVLSSRGPVLIEINSRLTSAYVALREVVSRNLAKDLLLICKEHILPEKPKIQGTFIYTL